MKFHGERFATRSGLGDATSAEADVQDAPRARRELARQEVQARLAEQRRNALKIAVAGVAVAGLGALVWVWFANRRRRRG